MDMWPEFVTDETSTESEPRAMARVSLTGWETVLFELTDASNDTPPVILSEGEGRACR